MDRRPHWSDELIEAVCDLIYTDYDGGGLGVRGHRRRRGQWRERDE